MERGFTQEEIHNTLSQVMDSNSSSEPMRSDTDTADEEYLPTSESVESSDVSDSEDSETSARWTL